MGEFLVAGPRPYCLTSRPNGVLSFSQQFYADEGPPKGHAIYVSLETVRENTFECRYIIPVRCENISRNSTCRNRAIQEWLVAAGLTLAVNKTAVLFLNEKRRPPGYSLILLGQEIVPQNSVKYLGVFFDSRKNFNTHIGYVTNKAVKLMGVLSRLMPNVSPLGVTRRKLYYNVMESVVLYEIHKKVRILIVTEEDVNRAREDLDRRLAAIRKETEEIWQIKWETSIESRWTFSWLPNVSLIKDSGFAKVDYYVTQVLTGHGCFRAFLHSIQRANTPNCWFGCEAPDDAEHTFFRCIRWEILRCEMWDKLDLDAPYTPKRVMRRALKSAECWEAFATFCT